MAASDFLCRAETRSVLWVMGGVFAFSILFQFCDGNFIGSLFSGLNFNRMNYMNTQINFTTGFDAKISRNDSIFSIESIPEGKTSVQSSTLLNYSSGVELLKPNWNLEPERAKEFGNIFKGDNEQNKDDIIPLPPPLISPDPQVDDNLTAPTSSHNPYDEVAVIVPLNSNATIQLMNSPAPSVSHRHVDTDNSTSLASSHNPNEATGLLTNDRNGFTVTKSTPAAKKASDKPVEGVVSISEMTNMLLRSSHPSNLLTVCLGICKIRKC